MRARAPEVIAGYLAVFAIFVSAVAIAYRPVRLAPAAIVLALIAAGFATERNERLTRFAVLAGALGWIGGMTVAVITDNPLW